MSQIMNELNNQELALLHAKFVVPVAISQILNGEQELDDVAEYAIHDIIGSLQPDTALLCIGLCAQQLAAHIDHPPIARALRIEADMIIDDYGPVWLAHEQGSQPTDQQALRSLLCYIPEDLESIGDLLDATLGELDEEQALAAILCDILSLQAHAHKEQAENELAAAGLQSQARETHNHSALLELSPNSSISAASCNTGYKSAAGPAFNNIIPFPQER